MTPMPEPAVASTSGKNIKSGHGMTADDVFFWANWILVGALVVGVLATYAIVVSGSMRDSALKLELSTAGERTAALEKETTEARAAIAEANARAAEANLALAKLTTPRSISPEQEEKITETLKEFAGTPFDFAITPNPEPVSLMNRLAAILTGAGWDWKSVSEVIVFMQQGKPNVGMATLTGLKVQIDHSKLQEWEKPVVALTDALKAVGLDAEAEQLINGIVNPNAIHIRIGIKP